jgi:hypothetical protein
MLKKRTILLLGLILLVGLLLPGVCYATDITVHLTIQDMYGLTRFDDDVTVQSGDNVLDVLYAAEDIDPAIDVVYDPDNPYITGGYVESMYGQASPWGERSDGWIYYVNDVMPMHGVAVHTVYDSDEVDWYWGTMDGPAPVGVDCDFNDDSYVNSTDLYLLYQHYNETGTPGWIIYDVYEDGVIDDLDIDVVALYM